MSYSMSKLCIAAWSHELALRISPQVDNLLVYSCDPGDVDTQMLRKGWAGYQGMRIEDANDEFHLITRNFDLSMHGKYFVGGCEARCNSDVYDNQKRIELWNELEKISGVNFYDHYH